MDEIWSAGLSQGTRAAYYAVLNESSSRQYVTYPRSATIFASVCAILFIVLGVIGNLVTSVALLCCPKLRTHATTAFVLSLCVSDLLFCSLSLPLTAARYIHEAWTLGDALCQLFPVLFYGNVAVSMLSMVAITINRYVLIACHHNYSRIYGASSIWFQLILIWAASFAMMVPPLAGIWGRLGLDKPTFSCTILRLNGRSPKKAFFIAGFAVPCIVIMVSYSCIYWRVRKSRKKLEMHRQNAANVRVSNSSVREREDSRLTLLMLTIFIAFLLCFLPLTLVNVFDEKTTLPALHVLASVMAWASSVVNPFIYAASNRQYRSAYKNLFDRLRGKKPSLQQPSQQRHSNNNADFTSAPQSTPLSGKSNVLVATPTKLQNMIVNEC